MPFNNFLLKKTKNNSIKFVDDNYTVRLSRKPKTYYASVKVFSDNVPLKRTKEVGELYDEGLDWEENKSKIKKKN